MIIFLFRRRYGDKETNATEFTISKGIYAF